MRMVIRSSDDDSLFDNSPDEFKMQLDKQISLNGYWLVALTEIKISYTSTSKRIQDLYVYTNVCAGSILGKTESPLLRRVHINKDNTNQIKINKRTTMIANIIFQTPYYVPVRLGELDQIHFYIKDETGRQCSFLDRDSCVTLHFKRHPLLQ